MCSVVWYNGDGHVKGTSDMSSCTTKSLHQPQGFLRMYVCVLCIGLSPSVPPPSALSWVIFLPVLLRWNSYTLSMMQ